MSSIATTPIAATRLYCEDCRFYRAPETSGAFGDARCQRPRALHPVELVARAAKAPDAFCDLQRGDVMACGPGGKWFEPVPVAAKVGA